MFGVSPLPITVHASVFIIFVVVYHMLKDSSLLLYFESTSFYVGGLLYFVVFISHTLKAGP